MQKYLKMQKLKAFKKAKEDYHTKTDFVKVLSINQDASKKVRYFKFLNDIFLNQNLKRFCRRIF